MKADNIPSAPRPAAKPAEKPAATVAKAVAETAEAQGLARRPLTNPIADIYQRMWKPEYPRLEILPEG